MNLSTTSEGKRPWYIWASAGVSALIGLYYFLLIGRRFALPTTFDGGVTFLWVAAIALGCFISAAAFVRGASWGKYLFLLVCMLLSGRLILSASRPIPANDTIALLSILVTLFSVFILTLTAWIILAIMWFRRNGLAVAGIIVIFVFFVAGWFLGPFRFF